MLTILSLNVGLLRLAGGLFEPTPYTRERFAALPAALIRTGADVLVLQEIYEESHRKQLVAALAKTYPHVGHIQLRRRYSLDNSLMALSREPLAVEHECFENAPLDERLLDNKGILAIRMQLPNGPRIEILNIHMTAGGAFRHPEHTSIERVRAQQIAQLLRRARAVRGAIPLIVGDLNAGPGVSDENYRLLEKAHYVDIHRLMHGANDEVTWDGSDLDGLGVADRR